MLKTFLKYKLPKGTTRAFTLIELMITITIMAVVISIGTLVFMEAQKSARDSNRKQDLHALQVALELFFQRNGRYPCIDTVGDDSDWQKSPNQDAPASEKWWIIDGCSAETVKLDIAYISQMPIDPKNNNQLPWETEDSFSYAYWSSEDLSAFTGCPSGKGQYYILATRLERESDPDVVGNKDLNKDYLFCDGNSLLNLIQQGGAGEGILLGGEQGAELYNKLVFFTSEDQ